MNNYELVYRRLKKIINNENYRPKKSIKTWMKNDKYIHCST